MSFPIDEKNTFRSRAGRAGTVWPERTDPIYKPIPLGNAESADFATVAAWAEKKGILCRDWEDLPRVNAVRERCALPTFKRLFPTKGRFG